MSHSWVLKRGGNIIKQFLKRQNFFSNLVSLSCLWRVRNINVSNSFSSFETVCFRAKENFQIYFLQTASDVRNIVLNLFSCFWRVRNFSNLFSSTCFWSVRNIDVSNLSSSSETACFWASERVLLPTLNVDVNPKKPAKPADLKMSTEVILRSLEGAGRGALSFLSRGPQRDPSPEGAGRGAVNSSGWRYARNREAA